MSNYQPQLSTDIIIENAERPPHELMHDTWGEVFEQNPDGTFALSAVDALAIVHQAHHAIRANGFSVEATLQAEHGGFMSARILPGLLEDEIEEM